MRSRSARNFVSGSAAALALAFALAGPAHAAAPQLTDARAWYVVNASNGEVLAQHDANVSMPIASITKLMTVIVALQHLHPSQTVTVTAQAAAVGQESIPLYGGQQITVHDLLEGALIQSANDAADALAAAAADGDIDRFVGWMNARARQLGLTHTHFVRPDGLDAPGHVSSAHDVSVLARVAMHLPIVRQLVATSSATLADGTTVHTWNDLLGVVPGVIGVKTGHTNDAGWCQVAAVRRDGYTLYVVVLGSPTRSQRNADLVRLIRWGEAQYRMLALVRPQAYAWTTVPFGRKPIPLVAVRSLVRVVRAGRPIVERVVAPPAVTLPVRLQQPLGRIEFWQGGVLLGSRTLVAARAQPQPGALARVSWYAGRTVHDLWGLVH